MHSTALVTAYQEPIAYEIQVGLLRFLSHTSGTAFSLEFFLAVGNNCIGKRFKVAP